MSKKQAETLLLYVSSDDYVKKYRSRLKDQFERMINQICKKLRSALHPAFDATEGDLAAIQGKKGEGRLFKDFPQFEQECESVAAKIRKQELEVEELAAEARKMAKEQYGYNGTAEM